MDPAINLRVTYTETDLVKLEFFQAAERLLWVDLTRDKACEWASAILRGAQSVHGLEGGGGSASSLPRDPGAGGAA